LAPCSTVDLSSVVDPPPQPAIASARTIVAAALILSMGVGCGFAATSSNL
jgi:hypothetical protein